MKLIELEQNTPQWHEYRKSRIGASDFALFACHKGLSKPIFTIDFYGHIYNKRNDIHLKDNIYMQHGRDREPFLREYYTNKYNVVCEAVVGEHDHHRGIFTSYDGYNPFNHTGLEIKTSFSTSDKFEEKMQYYVYQIVHQMYVGDLKYIDVLFEFKNGEIIERRYCKGDLPISYSRWCELCWEYLDELHNENNDDAIALLEQYDNLSKEIKILEDNKQILLNKIKELNILGVQGNFTISQSERKSYKYAEYCKDNNITLDDTYLSVSNSLRITKRSEQ